RPTPAPAAALWLASADPRHLAGLCGRLGAWPDVFALAGGFLVVPDGPPPAGRPRAVPLRRLAGHLYLPADAAPVPAPPPAGAAPRPPAAPPARRAAGRAALGFGQFLTWLGRVLRRPGLAKAGARLIRRAVERVPRLTEKILGKQEAALRELLRRFRAGDVEA